MPIFQVHCAHEFRFWYLNCQERLRSPRNTKDRFKTRKRRASYGAPSINQPTLNSPYPVPVESDPSGGADHASTDSVRGAFVQRAKERQAVAWVLDRLPVPEGEERLWQKQEVRTEGLDRRPPWPMPPPRATFTLLPRHRTRPPPAYQAQTRRRDLRKARLRRTRQGWSGTAA